MKPTVTNFTVSYVLDVGNGRKSSNFVSATFSLPEPCDAAGFEFDEIRLEASKKVTMWAIQDAVARGELSSDEARERIEVIKLNYDGMLKSLNKKRDNQ